MYRQFEIKDEDGLKQTLELYPEENNKIIVSGDDLELTLEMRRLLNNLMGAASSFMDGNTINKVEITEVEE